MSQKFFRLVPDNPNIPFMKYGNVFFIIGILITLTSLSFLFTKGLNYGVDFRGGTEVFVRFPGNPAANDIRETLAAIGYTEAGVQSYGDVNKGEYLIRVESEDLKLKSYQANFQTALDSLASKDQPALVRYSEDRLYVIYDKPVDPEQIKTALAKVQDQKIQIDHISKFGRASVNEYIVQFSGAGNRIVNALKAKFGETKVEVLQIEEVGQKVGGELRQQALGAVLISMLLLLVYIWFRFDFEFAPGAILALVHDTSVILGVFALFQLPFDLASIAAVLTVVGYSINDTIVTYDRARENMKKFHGKSFEDIINFSINETLGRTILTSITVLMATGTLYYLGGPITENFALALCVGVICGVYSTMCVASPVTIYIRRYMMKKAA